MVTDISILLKNGDNNSPGLGSFGTVLDPVDLNSLMKAKIHVSVLATVGVMISTLINGTCFYYFAQLFGFNIEYLYCLIFGVIVSPTDPVAVMALLKRLKVPKRLEAMIGDESLFNDGVAVVIFSVLLTIAFGSATGQEAGAMDANAILGLFVKEATGVLCDDSKFRNKW